MKQAIEAMDVYASEHDVYKDNPLGRFAGFNSYDARQTILRFEKATDAIIDNRDDLAKSYQQRADKTGLSGPGGLG